MWLSAAFDFGQTECAPRRAAPTHWRRAAPRRVAWRGPSRRLG
jgi:hypothetical protein